MIVSAIIVTGCFIGAIIMILTKKMNRAVAVLAGAIITYFVLTFLEGYDFTIFQELLFGTTADGFINLRALMLIIGMLLIVQICHTAGVFQFIGFKLIQLSRGKPFYLLLVLCSLSLLISAILNNILAVIILVPLTVVASLMLGIDPGPYIIAEAIMVNVGGILFSISSIPNILITTHFQISFIDFFINIGLFALLLFMITMVFFHLYYRKKLMIPKEKLTEVLEGFNVWNYVPDRKLFYKSLSVLIIVFVCFAVVPPSLVSLDIIAMTGGITLVILSKLNGREILNRVDLELIFYLLGIFVITGAMELLGVIGLIGTGLAAITGGNSFVTVITVLWASAFLSSSIDNIPITKVLIPVVDDITSGFTPAQIHASFYSLAFGANLGDNLTPFGDNILVMNLAEQNERPISFAEFLRLGFVATIIQLLAITLYFVFLNEPLLGLVITFIFGLALFLINFIRYLKATVKREEELIFVKVWDRIRAQDYRKEKKLILNKTINYIRRILKRLFNFRG